MSSQARTISLGFTPQEFSPGVHICQIFSNEEERQEALLNFIASGLRAGERTACFSEYAQESAIREFLGNYGVSYDEAKARGAFSLSGTSEVYFQDDRFDSRRMLSLLSSFHEDSVAEGYPAARVIGEMTPRVQNVHGGSQLLEYESRVSLLLREHPVTAVCQYDARAFDGTTIMDVLKVHPLMIVRGAVVQNPFFIPPEEYLRSIGKS